MVSARNREQAGRRRHHHWLVIRTPIGLSLLGPPRERHVDRIHAHSGVRGEPEHCSGRHSRRSIGDAATQAWRDRLQRATPTAQAWPSDRVSPNRYGSDGDHELIPILRPEWLACHAILLMDAPMPSGISPGLVRDLLLTGPLEAATPICKSLITGS